MPNQPEKYRLMMLDFSSRLQRSYRLNSIGKKGFLPNLKCDIRKGFFQFQEISAAFWLIFDSLLLKFKLSPDLLDFMYYHSAYQQIEPFLRRIEDWFFFIGLIHISILQIPLGCTRKDVICSKVFPEAIVSKRSFLQLIRLGEVSELHRIVES